MKILIPLLITFISSSQSAVCALDISEIDKPTFVRLLFEPARPAGIHFGYKGDDSLSAEDMTKIKQKGWKVDIFKGRLLYFDLSGPLFLTGRYNQENGQGLAEAIFNRIKKVP